MAALIYKLGRLVISNLNKAKKIVDLFVSAIKGYI